MAFKPNVGEEITLGGITYTVGEHPMAPGIPYGQEGRQGTVYQLIPKIETSTGWKAMKVFRSHYRHPKLVYLSEQLGKYAQMPGLLACERFVVTPQQNGELLSQYRELIYAVVMPWIEGPTWMDMILEKREISKRDSLLLARSLAKVLSGMEQRGLAHCDLSGANIILPRMVKDSIEDGFSYVELVDVEQMYTPQLDQPDVLLGASPGYDSIYSRHTEQWNHDADRFAGAVLLAEMLGWSDPQVRDMAWGDSYFMPEEVQGENERYEVLRESLRTHWGEAVGSLFEQAWNSQQLNECPTFGEWLLELMELDHHRPAPSSSTSSPAQSWMPPLPPIEPAQTAQPEQPVNTVSAYLQLEQGKELEKQGKLEAALDVYRSLQRTLPFNHALAQDLVMMVHELEARIEARRLLGQREEKPLAEEPPQRGKRKIWLISAVSVLLVFGCAGYAWSQIEAKKAAEAAKQQEAQQKLQELFAQQQEEERKQQEAAQLAAARQAEQAAKQQAEQTAARQAAEAQKQQQELPEQQTRTAQQQAEEAAKQAEAEARKKQQAELAAAKERARQSALRQQQQKKQAQLQAQKQAELKQLQQQKQLAEQKRQQEMASGANLIAKQKSGLWGYVKRNELGQEQVVIPYQYDFAAPFSEGLGMVKKNGQFGYVNTGGQVAIPLRYDWATSFKNGRATVKQNGENLVINKNGEVVK
ncbi:WG repeat-containing protein [Brevibacillus fulvus]|uniref:Protein kinase domain-containing protein n=1 Tax=Brevibacillus fulvus TaxID=1125967 RepID=A0A939BRM8_9BACL|nr:WG repeat-containing protein [Brevibacillus fulvus]MBM7589802.1 hypothetical protein [Brevibacillus fulvus]